MRVSFPLLTLSLSFVIHSPVHAFEGKVAMVMRVESGATMDITYSFKQPKIRTELSADGHKIATITDEAKHEIATLIPEQSQYLILSTDVVGAKLVPDYELNNAEIKETGRTETILGYPCREIIVKNLRETTELWVTRDIGTFVGMGQGSSMPMGGGVGGVNPALGRVWEEILRQQGGFPLRVISRNPAKQQTFRLDATKIEAVPQPSTLFNIPAGYKKIELPKRPMPVQPGKPVRG